MNLRTVNDVHSRLDETVVDEIIQVDSLESIRMLVFGTSRNRPGRRDMHKLAPKHAAALALWVGFPELIRGVARGHR